MLAEKEFRRAVRVCLVDPNRRNRVIDLVSNKYMQNGSLPCNNICFNTRGSTKPTALDTSERGGYWRSLQGKSLRRRAFHPLKKLEGKS